MTVLDPDGGKPIRLSYPQKLFAQKRETVGTAVPGLTGRGRHGDQRFSV